jgi:DNA-binding HxlR family transcriptional regulator
MANKRTYNDACGMGRALDLVGERWALHVVRELLLGPKRFTDLRTSLPGVSPDVLSQRLRELEGNGILRHHKLPPPAASHVYELTGVGLALEPAIMALGRWGGANGPEPGEGMSMSLDAHLVSLRTLFRPDLAGDLETTVNLLLADHPFRAHVAAGRIELERGEDPSPDSTLRTDPATLLDLIHGRAELSATLKAGTAQVSGDADTMAQFLGLFPLPEPALAA